ncbi:hypothetical protein IFM89_000826 [Coptis chinensis]|uniref:Uncharacterized protein n=1 Tax=Coptis chinensis TaxID=261450 RepID=A0A835IVB8_9MAGN|nr:hypothetical protein IFM89_000826 [Coptis chinensis]
MLMKLAWNFKCGSDDFAQFMRLKYLTTDGAQIGYHKYSSIWPGIRRALNEIDSRSQWVVGSGSRIDFWRDRWAGTRSIHEALHLTDRELRGCSSRVSSIIGNGHIYCPPLSRAATKSRSKH